MNSFGNEWSVYFLNFTEIFLTGLFLTGQSPVYFHKTLQVTDNWSLEFQMSHHVSF